MDGLKIIKYYTGYNQRTFEFYITMDVELNCPCGHRGKASAHCPIRERIVFGCTKCKTEYRVDIHIH